MAIPSRHNFSESLHHTRRSLNESLTRRSLPYRIGQYIETLINTAWKDQFGSVEFDVLIGGPDRLLNAILAYRAASQGLSVGLYHGKETSWEHHDLLISTREPYYHHSFTSMIEKRFDMKRLGDSLDTVIENFCFHIDQILDDNGDPLVVQIDSCKLIVDHHADAQKPRLWVEPDNERHVYPAIERLIFWPDTTSQRFHSDDKQDARFTVTAKRVWLTGRPIKELEGLHSYASALFGDASRPMKDFEFFMGKDRLEDLSEAAGYYFD